MVRGALWQRVERAEQVRAYSDEQARTDDGHDAYDEYSGGWELTDDQEQAIITKQVNVRKDSAQAYRDAGRDELAEAEEAELAILQKYLPAQLEESEVRTIIDEEIAKVASEGVTEAELTRVVRADDLL